MAVTRSKRLSPVERLAAMRENTATRALGEAMTVLHQARAREAQLESFAREYRARLVGAGPATRSGHDIQVMARFQDHLEGLIAAQQQVCRQAEVQLAQARQRWLAAHNRRRAMDQLISRFRQQEAVEAGRREQREVDELGLLQRRRQHA